MLRDNDNGPRKSPNDKCREVGDIEDSRSTIIEIDNRPSRVLSFLLLSASELHNRQAYLHLHFTSRERAVTQRNRLARDSVLFTGALLPLRYYHGAGNYAGASRWITSKRKTRASTRAKRYESTSSSSSQRIIVSGHSLDIIAMQIVYKPTVTLPRRDAKAQKSDKTCR